MINNQDPHSQIENDETPGPEYPNESDSEEGETNNNSALPNFIPQILPDDETTEGMNSLNSKQREVFDVVHSRAKDYVKYDRHNVEPIHIFFSGSGGTGKSNLVKVIYNATSSFFLTDIKIDVERKRCKYCLL